MPKLVAGWVLGTHNFNCKSSSLFTRIKKQKKYFYYIYIFYKIKKLKYKYKEYIYIEFLLLIF
jgi:hypothetical protein